jgi:hypothetical protein
MIDRMTEGPTTIFWDLVDGFRDPGPYRFRVQHSSSGNPVADDWADIGPEVTNTFYDIDNTKRDVAIAIQAHYRVILNTGTGRYISGPVSALQWLDRHQWRVIKEMFRRNRKALMRTPYRREGYLLIRRRFGPDCPRCLNPDTGEIQDSNCPVCYGTGKLGGYFQALPYQYAIVTPRVLTERVKAGQATNADDFRKGTFLGYPLLHTYDVFVDAHSDERFILGEVTWTESIGAVPVVQVSELGIADFGHVIYKFPLPQRQKPY